MKNLVKLKISPVLRHLVLMKFKYQGLLPPSLREISKFQKQIAILQLHQNNSAIITDFLKQQESNKTVGSELIVQKRSKQKILNNSI